MARYKYKIYNKNDVLVLTNWIDANTKEEALEMLEPLRQEHDGAHVKVIETTPTSQWKC